MPTTKEKDEFRSTLLTWSETHLREFPWRQTESSFRILITEILLQRTLAQKVVPVYRKLFSRYPEPGDLAEADVKDVAKVLEPLGLQNRRAKALVEIGELLSERDVPQSENELLELPFVGKYAANATLCFAHDQKRPVVDVNVVRVYSRVFDFDWDDDQDENAWDFAEEMLPDDDFQRYNLAIIDLGGLLCTSTNPSCEHCPLASICRYYQFRTVE